MKQLFVLVLLSAAMGAFSQDWPGEKVITAKKEDGVLVTVLPVTGFVVNKTPAELSIITKK